MQDFIIIKLFFLGLWALFSAIYWKRVNLALASKRWVTTNARVFSSSIEGKVIPQGGYAYLPSIVYVFKYRGHHYRGNRYRYLGYSGASKAYSEEIVRKFSTGKSIQIYFNPENPRESVIFPGISKFQIIYLISISLFLWACAFMVEIDMVIQSLT